MQKILFFHPLVMERISFSARLLSILMVHLFKHRIMLALCDGHGDEREWDVFDAFALFQVNYVRPIVYYSDI